MGMQPAGNNRERLPNPPMVEMENLATATECTGLIPAAVETEDQAEDYARMMAVHPTKPNQYAHPK
jgi:hypothetical protein